MKDLLLPLILVAIGLVLIAGEALLPSAGMLGFLAVVLLVAGIATAFQYGGMLTGTVFMGATMAACVVTISTMLKLWPHTRFGKLILTAPPPADEQLPDRSAIRSLVGEVGQAISLMLPSGLVEIHGKRYDATANKTIEAGTWVEVVKLRGQNLIVRPISAESARDALSQQLRQDDPLSQPAEDIVQDPFDDAALG